MAKTQSTIHYCCRLCISNITWSQTFSLIKYQEPLDLKVCFSFYLMYVAFIFLQLIAKEANCEVDEICDFELQLCDTQPSVVAGAMKEFIFSGRLDNLCMSFCSLKVCLSI